MKLSDYIISFLEKRDVRDVFLLAGGGIMHILDSLAQSKKINKYFNLHEQASGFSADGYALYTGKTGVCFVTTGPGGTNAVTPVTSSYIDSTPIVYVSGQVRTTTITKIKGVRQTGAQEADIISIVKPVTKYAVTVMKEDDIRYHLEKAFYLAKHGRPGPVWLEIPLDIQSKQVDEKLLRGFDPIAENVEQNPKPKEKDIHKIFSLLKNSKRPVIMAGSGITLANAKESFKKLIKALKIPVISSIRAQDLLTNDCAQYYFGCVGVLPNRYANYILQNSDLMISIGSGLRYYSTAYDDSNFAVKAKRVIVNISEGELEKLNMKGAKKIVSDAGEFMNAMLRYSDYSQPDREEWFSYCNKMKKKYPTKDEYIPENENDLNPYIVTHLISEYMGDSDVLVISPSSFGYAWNVPKIRKNQRFICHLGLGAMGTALPEAIGACAASGKRTVVCEGDGGLMPNLQELALLRQYRLPIKLFIDSNEGFQQIYAMQNSHFNGRHAGCTKESGLSFPDFKLLARAYGIKYIRIDSAKKTEKCIKEAFSDNKPTIIEMVTNLELENLPIIKSKMLTDGTMQTPSLEILFPFVSDEEHIENMNISESN